MFLLFCGACFGKQVLLFEKNAYAQESEITKIFSQKLLDIAKADKTTYIFVKDNYINRTEKINFLWQLAIKHKNSSVKFSYLTEILSDLKPIELTDTFIQTFNQSKNFKSKNHLMDLMVYSADYSENNLLTPQQIKYIPKIRRFFKKLLLHSKNNEIFEQTIFDYAAVMPLEQTYYVIKQAMNRPGISDKAKKNIRQKLPFIVLQIGMILSSKSLQSSVLPNLLSEIDHKRPDIQIKYNNMLLDQLKKLNPNKINNEIRGGLLNYIIKIKPKFKMIRIPTYKANIYYNWLGAYATLKTNNKLQKQKFIRDYILNSTNPAYQSILLTFADKPLLNSFSQNESLQIRNSIQSKWKTRQEIHLLYRKNKEKKFKKKQLLQRHYLSLGLGTLNKIKNSTTNKTYYDHNVSQQQ